MSDEERKHRRIFNFIFGAKEVEPMQIIHSGKDDPTFLLDLAYRTRDALREEIRIGRPGEKLRYVHTGMLDTNRELTIKERDKAQRMSERESAKFLKQNERKLTKLERQIAKLEKML